MGPRRSHRKSRNGCPQCKARRLKCDERYPCTNCVKHAIHCEYVPVVSIEQSGSDEGTPVSTTSPVAQTPVQFAQPNTPVPVPAQAQAQTQPQPQPNSHMQPVSNVGVPNANPQISPDQSGMGSEPERLNLLEFLPGTPQAAPIREPEEWALDLELMHHYCTVTCNTMVTREDARHVWRVIIPTEAYANEYLMHGILAISALHRAYLVANAQKKERYLKSAAFHIAIGLKMFRELIASPIDPWNWQPVFCFASMVNVYLLTTPIRLSLARWPAPISNMVELFANIKGLQALMDPFLHSLRKTQLAPLVNCIWLIDPEIIPSPSQVSQSMLPPDIWVQASQLHRFIDNYVFPPEPHHRNDEPTDRRKDYKVALESFERASRAIELAGVHVEKGMILMFAYPLSKQFHDDMEASEPAALVILAYFCVLVKLTEDTWYMKNIGTHLLEDVESKLRPEFREWLVWPKKWVFERR